MSQDFNDICKQGYVRHKTKKLPTWNKRWFILCRRSSKGNPRIEKYTDERAAQLRNDPKCIELIAVKNVVKCPAVFRKYTVSVEFKEGQNDLLFSCESDHDTDEWLSCIREVCSFESTLPPLLDAIATLYTRATVFPVYLLPNPLLSCYGECIMCVTCEDLILRHLPSTQGGGGAGASGGRDMEIASWKLATLRRYGRDEDKFMFECGRHSQTGEGLFIFNTVDGDAIYQSVHSATLAIASAHSLAKQVRPSLLHSTSAETSTKPAPKNFLRSTKSSPADRAPQPLPRPPKARAPSPPPGPPPPPPPLPLTTNHHQPTSPSYDNRNRTEVGRGRRAEARDDSDSDKDDYEILADARSSSIERAASAFPISSIDSMLTVTDPNATYLRPSVRGRDDEAKRNGTGAEMGNGEVNNNTELEGAREGATEGAEGATGGGNNNKEEVIYEERGLPASFRNFLKLRKEDAEREEIV